MKVVHSAEVPWVAGQVKGGFATRRKPLGGEKMPVSLWELPPGKRSFPFHRHLITEEALFVISGKGVVRGDDGEHPIGPGDYVSFPPGGSAHQLRNDGTEPLVYLGLSAVFGHDIVEYPDSDKIAAAIGAYPTGKRYMFKKSTQVEYFDGEKTALE